MRKPLSEKARNMETCKIFDMLFCKTNVFFSRLCSYQSRNYILKVNNRNIRTVCEICSKLTIKTPEHVIDVVLVLLLLCSGVSIVDLNK